MGETLIRTMPDLSDIHELVVGHHEHFDGTGYPRGLRAPTSRCSPASSPWPTPTRP